MADDEQQLQNITRDVSPDDPNVTYKLIDIVGQLNFQITDLRRRVAELEEVVQN